MRSLETRSSEETFLAGLSLGKTLKPNSVVAFFGELGAGKTTFIKGFVSTLSPETVTSPTFSYLHIYRGPQYNIYHFDLYRLRSEKDFIDLGFGEYLKNDGICLIEWAEKIGPILPSDTIRVSFEHRGEDRRAILFIQ